MKDFSQLIVTIDDVHNNLHASAANAVNKALTIRNWLIGYYIVEYEQKGEDRAAYGQGLMAKLADKLKIKGLTPPELSRCRQFYSVYPQILGTLSQELLNSKGILKLGTASQVLTAQGKSDSSNSLQVPTDRLFEQLAYSHFTELIKIDEPLKRTFYELECIKGTWTVRELRRQINSLYFERSGLSKHPKKLAELIQERTTPQLPKDIIKNIYAFEFLDIPTQSIVEEADLETALLDNLQQFIIELGHGFCLEARQKRILIGENYYFIDLVFYHRILKCHVLVELKIGAFEHGDIGQLNTYLNFYKSEIIQTDDNPPLGILLVAEKDHALVKYATAGMDENLFVQKYLVQLPNKEQLQNYIESELANMK